MHYVKTKNANLGVRRFTLSLAEEGGFEPPVSLTPHTLSKRAH